LYVLEGEKIKLTVDSLSSEKVETIEKKWGKIKKAVNDTVELLKEIGFDNSIKFSSYNAVMPLVYWLYNHENNTVEIKKQMRHFFVCSQIKGIYNRSVDTHLGQIREVLKGKTSFPIGELLKHKFGGVSLEFSDEDVADLFDTHQKGATTFMLLTLLYPDFNYGQKEFHQDHLHPFAGFEGKENEKKLKDKLKEVCFSDDKIDDKIKEWKNKRNCLANLQMLEGKENQVKSDKPLREWLKDGNNKERCQYLPECSDEDFDAFFAITNFDAFMEKRQTLMQAKLTEILCGEL